MALAGVIPACTTTPATTDGGPAPIDVFVSYERGLGVDTAGRWEASVPRDVPSSTLDAGADASDAAPVDVPASCAVRAPTECPEPAPRYGDVESIFTSRCTTCHHGAPNGPWSLLGYDHVADWQDTIRDELLRCAMPPADAGALSDEERQAILVWLRCGLPR